MPDAMQFDLVSPEKRLAAFEVTEVQIPGAEGDMTVMAGHTPVITTLRPGFLRADGPQGASEFVVTDGFAEITADTVSIIAEKAAPKDASARELLQEILEEAREKAQKASDEDRTAAEKFVADLVHLMDMMD